MAENKANPLGSISRQEEEVRDLFHMLTKAEVTETKESEKPSAIVSEQTITSEPVEQVLASATAVIEPSDEQTFVHVEPKEDMQEETSEEEPFPLFSSSAKAEEYDEFDNPNELPPLVMHTAYDDEADSDDDDEYALLDGFIVFDEEQKKEAELVMPPRMQRNPIGAFGRAVCKRVPVSGDGFVGVLRKSALWLAVVLFAGVLTYVLYNVWWMPEYTESMYAEVANVYHPDREGTAPMTGSLPIGIRNSFVDLYNKNNDVRGWLSFHADGSQDFLNIEYPVMYTGDNETYLSIDFNGNRNKSGALFFDMRANLDSVTDTNDSLIIYGQNASSGQMFAGLNKFIGNVNNARVASTLTMNTLFANGRYKVFAVVITDENASENYAFNTRRTKFSDAEEFLSYTTQLRERSLFDYPVDMVAGDELLLLSTNTEKSASKLENGRLTIVARKVRAGESLTMNTSQIVKNDDVIMPYAWYAAQDKKPHAYYSQGDVTAPSTTVTTKEAEE